jgi:hypothetical protein
MNSLERFRLTLDEAFSFIGAKWITDKPHIIFDPKVKAQYRIRRQCSHDGTLLFSIDLMQKAFLPLLSKDSFYKRDGFLSPEEFDIKYIIGPIKVINIYGLVDLPCGRVPGQRERVVIPVRCEYEPILR